jgi:hypothetical protein
LTAYENSEICGHHTRETGGKLLMPLVKAKTLPQREGCDGFVLRRA